MFGFLQEASPEFEVGNGDAKTTDALTVRTQTPMVGKKKGMVMV